MTDQIMSPLVANVFTAMFNDTHNTTGYLLQRYQRQIAELEAELTLVRSRVLGLLDGPYMPTPSAIEEALYPGEYAIRKLADEMVSE